MTTTDDSETVPNGSHFDENDTTKSTSVSKATKETIDLNIGAIIDGLIASTKRLEVTVDDSRKNGFGLILFKLTDKPENKHIPLVEALISNGFQYWHEKGYWR